MRWGFKSKNKDSQKQSYSQKQPYGQKQPYDQNLDGFQDLNLQMRMALATKQESKKTTCLEAEEAHTQFKKLKAEEHTQEQAFSELFEQPEDLKNTKSKTFH